MNFIAKLTGRRIAELQTIARARHVGVADSGAIKQAQVMNLLAQPNDAERRKLRYDSRILLADRTSGRTGGTWTVMAIGKRFRLKRLEKAAAAVDERAKRREALVKMRTLWNDSAASTDRAEGEDGVAYQKRLRAEW